MTGSGSSCFGIFRKSQDFINDKEFEKIKSKKLFYLAWK